MQIHDHQKTGAGIPAQLKPGFRAPQTVASVVEAPVSKFQEAQGIEAVLARSYEQLLLRVDKSMQAGTSMPGAPVVAGDETGAAAPPADDFSPAAVSDRIMDFINQRIEMERASGASPERLQFLFEQASKGLEKGFGEARKIIEANDLFHGEIQDNFFETVSLVEKGMGELRDKLFGGTEPQEGTVGTEVQSQQSAPAAVSASSTSVAAAREQRFSMEIQTREGDVIRLQVGAAQSAAFSSASVSGPDGWAQAISASFSSSSYFSFSVEGDLNEEELAAINTLFGEVNDVAEVFFGGDTDKAFDMAMNVGLDAEQLAGFAVNMNRTEVTAAKQAYASVDGARPKSDNEQMFQALADFASRVKQAKDVLEESVSLFDTKPVLADLLARLKPELPEAVRDESRTGEDTPGQSAAIAQAPALPLPEQAVAKGNFRRFIEGLLG